MNEDNESIQDSSFTSLSKFISPRSGLEKAFPFLKGSRDHFFISFFGIFGRPTNFTWGIFYFLAIVLVGVKACYFASPESFISRWAAWAWLVISFSTVLIAFIYSVQPLFDSTFWKGRDRVWYFVAFFLPCCLVLFDIQGITYTSINTESAQQVASGVFLGIYSLAFLAYPARQYLLMAIPTLIFGKGLVLLRLGFGFFYLISYTSFLSGNLYFFRHNQNKYPVLLSCFAGLSVTLATFPLLNARQFEQVIIPISLTLFFLAGLLHFLARPAPFSALMLFWSLGMLPYSYTPSLGFWVLAMPMLAYLFFLLKKTERWVIAGMMGYGILTLAISFLINLKEQVLHDKITLGGSGHLYFSDWLHRYAVGFHATYGQEESLIPIHLVLACIIIVYWSLKQKDIRFLLLIIWALGIVFMSLTLNGHCWRTAEYDIHRAMIILPPLSLGVTLYLSYYWKNSIQHLPIRTLIIGVLCVLILNTIYLPLIRRVPGSFNSSDIIDAEEATLLAIHKKGASPKTIYVVPPYCALDDALSYFLPDTKIIYGTPPSADTDPGAYVISYINPDPESRTTEQFARHIHPRPYLQIKPVSSSLMDN